MRDHGIGSNGTNRSTQATAKAPSKVREGGARAPARWAGRVQGGASASAPQGRARQRRPVTVRAAADAAGRDSGSLQ